MGLLHLGDQFYLADALLPGADHDARAVGVVGTQVNAPPPAELLEADPNVRLQILHEVAHVDVAIGVRQGAVTRICLSLMGGPVREIGNRQL